MSVSPNTPKRRVRAAWWSLFVITASFLVYVALNYGAGMLLLRFEYANLAKGGWLLIPPQAQEARLESEARLTAGTCAPGDASCGEWMPLHKLDFTKIKKERLESVFLVARTNLKEHAARAQKDAPFQTISRLLGHSPERAPLVLRFADTYAELTAWVDGRKVGATSRHMSLSEKPFLFTNTEAIPIPLSAAATEDSLIVVRVERMPEIDLPPIFRMNSFSLGSISEFMLVESMGLLTLVGCVLTQFFLLLYHLGIWLGRRSDVSNLAFVVYAAAAVSQEFFFYNLAGYFGIPINFTWHARMVLLHGTPVAFIACAWAIGIPISHLWPHIVGKLRGVKETSFMRLSLSKKIGVTILESVAFIAFPILAVSAMFLPLHVSSTILYKFSVPASVLTSFCFYFVAAAWFFRTSKELDIVPLLPFAIAIAVSQAGTFTGMLGALGVSQFSGLSVGYANLLFTVLFAVTLANNFSTLHLQLEKMRDRLEQLLLGSREISSAHEALPAVAKAAEYFVAQILLGSTPDVCVQLVEGDDRRWSECEILKGGTPLAEFKSHAMSVESIQSSEELIRKSGSHLAPGNEIVIPIRTGESDLGLLRMKTYQYDELHSDDEHFLNTFSLSLSISLENIRFLQESQERAWMEAELGAARAIQEALLPSEWVIPTMEIASHYQAASQTGGDWFGFHLFPDGKRADVFIGDVTGHGIPSALLTGVIYGSVYSMEMTSIHLAHLETTHEERLQRFGKNLHAMVRNSGRNKLMMTMALLSIDLETGSVTYLNAAHNPIIWMQHEEKATRILANPGTRLGYSDAETNFGVRKFQMRPGDTLFLYTDGLVENSGPDCNSIFTEKKLRKSLEIITAPEEIKKTILDQGASIWLDHPPADDVSFVVLRWTGPASAAAEAS